MLGFVFGSFAIFKSDWWYCLKLREPKSNYYLYRLEIYDYIIRIRIYSLLEIVWRELEKIIFRSYNAKGRFLNLDIEIDGSKNLETVHLIFHFRYKVIRFFSKSPESLSTIQQFLLHRIWREGLANFWNHRFLHQNFKKTAFDYMDRN